jgi:hypothetical protein
LIDADDRRRGMRRAAFGTILVIFGLSVPSGFVSFADETLVGGNVLLVVGSRKG